MPDSFYDSRMEELLRHKLDQENRFTKLEGRVTATEATGQRVEGKVDELIKTIGRWGFGLILVFSTFALGLIGILIKGTP